MYWRHLATLTFLTLCGCSTPPQASSTPVREQVEDCPRVRPAPHLLPGSRPEHRNPGFWLTRLDEPDELLLTPDQIEALNQRALALSNDDSGLGARYSLLTGPNNAAPILSKMHGALDHHRNRASQGHRVTLDGADPGAEFFDNIERIQRNGQITSHYHTITQLAELRCHPSAAGLYEYEGDVDFDMLLCSTLRPGEVARVISAHPDGWRLVRTSYAAGWVQQDQLGPELDLLGLREYLGADPFVVVTDDRVPVWRSPRRRELVTTVFFGLRLPNLGRESSTLLRVRVPSNDGLVEGFISAAAVSEGYLPLTRRNVLHHAFARLDDVFGWAGAGGDRDCSRFLMDLFALFGLQLPRNSYFQSRAASITLDTSEMNTLDQRRRTLDQALEQGIPLVYMPGHIMLLLGRDGEDYHALHQFSGYRVGCRPGHDVKMAVDRLSVTTLRLGEGSERDSFMERFTTIAIIGEAEEESPPVTDN